jgi:hypothetical protein
MDRIFTVLRENFEVVPMKDHAAQLARLPRLRLNEPLFATA